MRKVERTWYLIRQREGLDGLPAHLERRYAIEVRELTQLDVGVYRVDLRDGARWIARLFPAARAVERAEGDAEVLRFLAEHDFPAERLAHAEPVSIHAGQALLVTRFVEGAQLGDRSEKTFRALGELLGRLHTRPEAKSGAARRGGAIHSFTLNEGGLRDELADALSWLAEAEVPAAQRPLHDSLLEQIAQIDHGDGLPQALVHPDPVLKNFIATPDGAIVPIDWTGAGRCARAHSLAFLLLCAVTESRWNPASERVAAVIDGYRAHVKLDPEELAAIATAMPLHVLVRDCAAFCLGRMRLDEVTGGYAVISRMAGVVADRARRAFEV
jgi:Ser/Thr protein kinase RdoA (MazF antagonist)